MNLSIVLLNVYTVPGIFIPTLIGQLACMQILPLPYGWGLRWEIPQPHFVVILKRQAILEIL